VRAWLAGLDHLGWVIGDAMLVSSELVTNAVLQSEDPSGWIEVSVSERGERIVIAVSDGRSAQRMPDLEAQDGVGRVIVEAVARRWGSESGPPHTVWAEL
jgi:anti-sigma regulatory factor (Ser/Thr protein kinase)